MKRTVSLILSVCLLFALCACDGSNSDRETSAAETAVSPVQPNNESEISPSLLPADDSNSSENDTMNLDAFCSDIEGIYVNLDTATDVSYEFMDISDGIIVFAAYPGGWSRPGTITNVVPLGNDSYEITLFYPQEEDEWGEGEIIPALEEMHTVIIKSDTFQFEGEQTVWTYMGTYSDNGGYEGILDLVQQRIGELPQGKGTEDMTGKELKELYSDGWTTKQYVETFGSMVTLYWYNTYTFDEPSMAYTDTQMKTISDYLIQCGVDASGECYMDGIDSISIRTKQKDSDGNIIYTRTTSVQYIPATPNEPLIREW